MVAQRKQCYAIVAAFTITGLLLHAQRRDIHTVSVVTTWDTDELERENALLIQKLAGLDGTDFSDPVANDQTTSRPSKIESSKSAIDQKSAHTTWKHVKQRHPVKSSNQLPFGFGRLPKVQAKFAEEPLTEKKVRLQRQAAVKSAFERSWKTYHDFAWGRDEVFPVRETGNDYFGGWGATLIDSLDTLWIMGLEEDFRYAADAATTINFSPGSNKQDEINTFETNIRILGGLLGAYDLSGDKRLLQKAKEVGDMLYVAFDTPNRMPVTRWRPMYAAGGFEQAAHQRVLAAEIGSFSMEFSRLSQMTGDSKWFDAAQKITDELYHAHDKTRLPGMFDLVLDAKNKDFRAGGTFKLGAMADSFSRLYGYEYFSKTYALLGGQSSVLRELYITSADTAIKHTIFRPYTPDNADILVAGEIQISEGGRFVPRLRGEHLGCFAGGWLALGGKLTNNTEHVEVGRKLTDGCIWAYRNSPLRIMPEVFEMDPCPRYSACEWSDERWLGAVREKHGLDLNLSEQEIKDSIQELRLAKGFTAITDRRYVLRAEAIESIFILYRITGDKSLMDAAWDMFTAIEKHTRTDNAYAGIQDVTVDRDPDLIDRMESFWFAATLKYFYLIFSDPELMSLDEFVYNTEAHPFRRPSG